MYVPTDGEIDAMPFAPYSDINGVLQNAAAQRTALKQFIAQDKYLNGRRGSYTEKYGGETPWYGQLDLRILQDFKLRGSKSQAIQVSIDMVNFGNFISSKWGVRKYATTSGYFQPLSVALTGVNNNTPVYTFDPSLKQTFNSNPDLQSRWQMQIGVRYIF
jgi:hypothetical protein